MNEKEIALRNQVLNELSHTPPSTISSTNSTTYILPILDINSIQTIDFDEEEEEETDQRVSTTRQRDDQHVTSIGITFLSKDAIHEQQLHVKISPCSELFPDITSPTAIKESLASLSNCFQILSSRSRGLVWKKLQIFILKLSKFSDTIHLCKALRLWKSYLNQD